MFRRPAADEERKMPEADIFFDAMSRCHSSTTHRRSRVIFISHRKAKSSHGSWNSIAKFSFLFHFPPCIIIRQSFPTS